MVAQTCLQSGLSVVYQELLDYGGDEIYFHSQPELAGRTFREVQQMYETSCVIGVKKAGDPPVLNPPMESIMEDSDRIIAISEDDDTVVLSGEASPRVRKDLIYHQEPSDREPSKIIMLGWNWRAPIIIRELSNYLTPGPG